MLECLSSFSICCSSWLLFFTNNHFFHTCSRHQSSIYLTLSCDSKNVIYLASCKKCRLQYVGSTTTGFRIRFRNHKSVMLTNKTTCEVAIHFNKIPHTLGDFSFKCIDQVQTPNYSEEIDRLLITKEAYWSAQLFTLAPHGLNKRKEFHSKNRINFVIINFLSHMVVYWQILQRPFSRILWAF